MSPTTYPRIAASGIETQPRSHPSWLLPHICTHSVHMTEILILFILYSDIFLMHRPNHSVFPDVLIISAGAFTKLDHDATRNVIGAQSATPQPFVVQVLWSPENCSGADVRRLSRASLRGFQDEVYEDFDLFFSKQWGKSPWTFCTYSEFLYLFFRIRTTW
jgi:hypothetical protein